MSEKTQNREERAIYRLLALTRSGELKWASAPTRHELSITYHTVYQPYYAIYNNAGLYIYRASWKEQPPKEWSLTGMAQGYATRSVWCMEYVDVDLALLRAFPTHRIIRDLYDTIVAKTTGYEDLISSLSGE